MSPGKRSPVIRTGLFLTGDQSHDGGKGEPSKTAPQRGVLIVPLNCASLVCGTGVLFHPRGVFIVLLPPSLKLWRDKQLRKLVCGTGVFVSPQRGVYCAASAVAEAMAGQAASQARLRHGFFVSPQRGVLIVLLPPSLKLWRDKQLRKLVCGTGGFIRTIRTESTSRYPRYPHNKSALRAGPPS